MRYCGISEYFHDAGIAFLSDQGDIEFATHSERYTKRKYDPELSESLVGMIRPNDHTVFYERYDETYYKNDLRSMWRLPLPPIPDSYDWDDYVDHHISHAALAYYTRPWESKDDTVILTMDGVGENQSAGIYDSNFNCLEKHTVPKSVGLFYNEITRLLGLKATQDEYVVMGMASYGEPTLVNPFLQIYENLPQTDKKGRGVRHKLIANLFSEIKNVVRSNPHEPQENIAASVQRLSEIKILELAHKARKYGSKLCYAGGVAQNVVANSLIRPLFDEVWIPTAPGDSGSALGCAAYIYGKHTNNDRINWRNPYLGYDIKREVNPKEVVDHLLEHTYCGIANGRAEYGPRALGNRSLIADVRYDVKDTVNEIKRRQKYRPFAPAILAEFAGQYFEGPMNEYMQYTSKALHDYKSVIHVDGTSRVQLVQKDCTSIIRPILEEYYEKTGIPMLLNTSLNIRGMPMVNDEKDAELWERKYEVKVF